MMTTITTEQQRSNYPEQPTPTMIVNTKKIHPESQRIRAGGQVLEVGTNLKFVSVYWSMEEEGSIDNIALA